MMALQLSNATEWPEGRPDEWRDGPAELVRASWHYCREHDPDAFRWMQRSDVFCTALLQALPAAGYREDNPHGSDCLRPERGLPLDESYFWLMTEPMRYEPRRIAGMEQWSITDPRHRCVWSAGFLVEDFAQTAALLFDLCTTTVAGKVAGVTSAAP